MEKFTRLTSEMVPLRMDNIDTDQIIPARFLKSTTREGFGENLFRDWRYDRNTGESNKEFPLNNPIYKGKILLCGNNFGCGSSREHAAWAIYDYGFRAVVSSMFADIFKNNALNNGLLPIEVSHEELEKLFNVVDGQPEIQAEIELALQTLSISDARIKIDFEINSFKKDCLLNGFDNIDFLLSMKDKIQAYEIKGL